MTASNLRPQLRSAMLQERSATASKKKYLPQKGFTLVELMVVIVIVGILSAVALPRFLGVKDKAKINVQLGEAAGLAKECAAAIISESPYPPDYNTTSNKTSTGLTISGNCNASGGAPTNDVVFTTEAATAAGAKCGGTALPVGKKCVITVVAASAAAGTDSAGAATAAKTAGDITYAVI